MLKKFSVLVLLLHTLCNSMEMHTNINALHRSQESFPFSTDSGSSSLKSSCELVRPVSPFTKNDSFHNLAAAISIINNLCATQATLPFDQSQANGTIYFSQIDDLLKDKTSCGFLLGKCHGNQAMLSIIMHSVIRSDNLSAFKLFYSLLNHQQHDKNEILLSACFFGSHKIVEYCITELKADSCYYSAAHVNNPYAFGSCFRVTAATPLLSALQGKYNKQSDDIAYAVIISLLETIDPRSNNSSGVYFLEDTPLSINELVDFFALQDSLEEDDVNSFCALLEKYAKIQQHANKLIGIASGLGAIRIFEYLLLNYAINVNYWCARPEDIHVSKNTPNNHGKYFIRRNTALDQALYGQAINPENNNYSEIIRLLRARGASDEATGVVVMPGPLLPLDDFYPSKRVWGER